MNAQPMQMNAKSMPTQCKGSLPVRGQHDRRHHLHKRVPVPFAQGEDLLGSADGRVEEVLAGGNATGGHCAAAADAVVPDVRHVVWGMAACGELIVVDWSIGTSFCASSICASSFSASSFCASSFCASSFCASCGLCKCICLHSITVHQFPCVSRISLLTTPLAPYACTWSTIPSPLRSTCRPGEGRCSLHSVRPV